MIVGWYRKNSAGLKHIFQLQNLFIDAKTMLIHKFNQVNDIGTFIHTPDGGYKVTAPEGYVAVGESETLRLKSRPEDTQIIRDLFQE